MWIFSNVRCACSYLNTVTVWSDLLGFGVVLGLCQFMVPVSCYQVRQLFAAPHGVALDCVNACCMHMLDSVSLPVCHVYILLSERCFHSCFSSAPTPHDHPTVPEGLHLWSAGEHCHPLWGEGKASSQVRQSAPPIPLMLVHLSLPHTISIFHWLLFQLTVSSSWWSDAMLKILPESCRNQEQTDFSFTFTVLCG